VVLGTAFLHIQQMLQLGRSAIIELDFSEEDAASILANKSAGCERDCGRER
jgi:flagellar motor switch/type III secretory pathway protein FliN